jgi:hypothetical protein
VKAPLFLSLYAPQRAVGDVLFGAAIVGHVNRKPAAQIRKHVNAPNRLAPRPQAHFLQADARQVCLGDPDFMPGKPHAW